MSVSIWFDETFDKDSNIIEKFHINKIYSNYKGWYFNKMGIQDCVGPKIFHKIIKELIEINRDVIGSYMTGVKIKDKMKIFSGLIDEIEKLKIKNEELRISIEELKEQNINPRITGVKISQTPNITISRYINKNIKR